MDPSGFALSLPASSVSTITTTATATAIETMQEYGVVADRHPVVSFLSAFFWVTRTYMIVSVAVRRKKLTDSLWTGGVDE